MGYSEIIGGQYHAFLYDGSMMHDLGTLGGGYSVGYGINDSGQVTGWSFNSGGQARAFLYDGSMMHDLNDLIAPNLGYVLYEAWGINNSGQIVANAYTSMGTRAVLLTPEVSSSAVPEPSSILLFTFCIIAALITTARRKKLQEAR